MVIGRLLEDQIQVRQQSHRGGLALAGVHYLEHRSEHRRANVGRPRKRSRAAREEHLRRYYRALQRSWGRQHWWPASTRFEVIVGAYLTQNTSWINVEHALRKLRSARRLSLQGIRSASLTELETLVRPSGYFRQKALRLKVFVDFLDSNYGGSLRRMFAKPTENLRQELLDLPGIGPETADSILLYAGQHPVFVVDAYTRRILERHQIITARATYEEIRSLMQKALLPLSAESSSQSSRQTKSNPALHEAAHPASRMSTTKRSSLAQVFNDTHGFIVSTGKQFCLKTKPLCEHCPLCKFLPSRVYPA